MIDFHTHILPGIDDGSTSVQESVRMLKALEMQGVESVVLTPHFYAYKTDITSFLEERKMSFDSLVKRLKEENIRMNMYLAAEVLYFEELWRVDNLESLCISGTKYIMLEMPFSKWTDSMISGVEKIISRGLTPVIAHFERYARIHRSMDRIYELVNIGAMLQINCDWFGKPLLRRWVASMLKNGIVSAIGTDCHNMEKRAPNYKVASDFIEKKLKGKESNLLYIQQDMIMRNAVKSYDCNKVMR